MYKLKPIAFSYFYACVSCSCVVLISSLKYYLFPIRYPSFHPCLPPLVLMGREVLSLFPYTGVHVSHLSYFAPLCPSSFTPHPPISHPFPLTLFCVSSVSLPLFLYCHFSSSSITLLPIILHSSISLHFLRFSTSPLHLQLFT